MILWSGEKELELPRPRGAGWVRFVVRVVLVALAIFGLMVPMFLLRWLGFKRLSEEIVRLACSLCLKVIGIRVRVEGVPMTHAGAVVSNHASWLDIFVLNAVQRVYFVAKAEVRNWPVIGVISRGAGTVFIERRSGDAHRQKEIFLNRILRNDKLLFFPEGTSTDGRRVLKFRSSLFAAFFEPDLRDKMWIQPVTVSYCAPETKDPKFYGWWGDMDFAPHFAMVLASAHQGEVVVRFSDALQVSQFRDRKELCEVCETAVRKGLQL